MIVSRVLLRDGGDTVVSRRDRQVWTGAASSEFVVTRFGGFTAAEPTWRALEKTHACFIFQTYEWLSNWQRFVGSQESIEPCLALVETLERQPLMFLPLGIRPTLWRRILVWLGGDLSDYGAPILMPDSAAMAAIDMRCLWPILHRALPPLDHACLEKQPEHIGGIPNPFFHLATHQHPFRIHSTCLVDDWPNYYARKRGKKSRATDRRSIRKLDALGKIEYLIAEDPATIDQLLDALFREKSRQLRELGARDLFQMRHYRNFVAHMAHSQADRGLIHLSGIMLNDKVVAVHLGALHKHRLYILLPTFVDGAIARWSPGNLLFLRLFEWAFNHQVAVVDFTIGDEPYKMTWCETSEPITASYLPISLRGHVSVAWIRCVLAVKTKLRSSSRLWAVIIALRQRLIQAVSGC